jgi:hypothetical protein
MANAHRCVACDSELFVATDERAGGIFHELRITLRAPRGKQITNLASPLPLVAIEFEELDGRGVLELDAELAGDLAQGVIEMGEVIDCHIADEGGANFVVTGTPVQPTEEEE